MIRLHSKNHSVIHDESIPLWDSVQKLSGVFTHIETTELEKTLALVNASEVDAPENEHGKLYDTSYMSLRIREIA